MANDPGKPALQALQDDLLALKQQIPGTTLKKAKEIWPIIAKVPVDPPANFDTGTTYVVLTLNKDILQLLQGQGSNDSAACASGLHISLQSSEIPAAACQQISGQLHSSWSAAVQKTGLISGKRDLSLQLPGQLLSNNFVTLLTSIPGLIDSYESVDETGRTVRRYTIVSSSQPAGDDGHTSTEHAPAASQTTPSHTSDTSSIPAPGAVQTIETTQPAKAGTPQPVCQGSEANLPTKAAMLWPSGPEQSDSDKDVHSQVQPPQQPPPSPTNKSSKQAMSSHTRDGQPSEKPTSSQLTGQQPSQQEDVPQWWALMSYQQLVQELRYISKRYPNSLKLADEQQSTDAINEQVSGTHKGLSVEAKAFVPQAAVHAANIGSQPAKAALATNSNDSIEQLVQALETLAVLAEIQQTKEETTTAVQDRLQHNVFFELLLQPTDPCWDRGALGIVGHVQQNTAKHNHSGSGKDVQPPKAPSTSTQPLLALNLHISPNMPLPAWLRSALNDALRSQTSLDDSQTTGSWLAQGGAVRNAVRHLENYAGQVAVAAEQHARAAGARTALGQGHVASLGTDDENVSSEGDEHGDEADSAGQSSSSWEEYDDSDQHSDEGADNQDDSEGGDEVQFTAASAGEEGSSSGPAAWALELPGLQLDHLVAVEALRSVFQLSCSRCSTTGTLSVASDAVADGAASKQAGGQRLVTGSCPGCHQAWTLTVRPKLVHEASNVLCVLKPEGCRPVDLLPSLFAGQCASCSSVMSLRNVQVGMATERDCSSCHHHLGLNIPAISFVPRGPPRGELGARGLNKQTASAKASRSALAKQQGQQGNIIQVGQPLPNRGACKHYKHSYRWLRFPCCGQRYACDICHDEASVDGHFAQWASRMVCGFCSTEQAVAAVCKACGKKLAATGANPAGRFTRFWEGGEGQRDKSKMDSRDAHKYRNSKMKTKSAKHKRVGPKAWSKELKKKENQST